MGRVAVCSPDADYADTYLVKVRIMTGHRQWKLLDPLMVQFLS